MSIANLRLLAGIVSTVSEDISVCSVLMHSAH